ncbi:maternal B9.10 protein [Nasonia vitripennis]|uniref:Anti-proliferative protein domain-containing protein n=1 Tax=Nasonia vitripennis TaxID=7425 RepID=A0A7M7LJM7_NASVI|nr:maternal B9.10 protein [Nasonia vitripennis]XP_008213511.1 maternal B9.10 protein [Nasonia vitripennis]
MRNEITAAVLFLVQLIEKSEKFSPDQLDCFQQRLVELLMERFKNHWFPDKPFKGQGYRCIRVNGHNRRDATIERAANAAGVRYEDLSLPVELTLWVDPKEVCCRFGESKGSYCTLASFDDKENKVPLIMQRIEKIEKDEKQVNNEKPASTPVTVTPQQKSKPLGSANQNLSNSNNTNNNNSNNSSNSNNNSSSNNNNNSSSSSNNNNSNGPNNKRRNLNSPRLHLNRNRWFNHSFMGYGPHPMSQPWYNVMPPHFLGGPSPPPFIGHRASKWIHSSSYPTGPSRFHHWSPKATLKV